MTPDARISHDLAILGRASRERPLALSTTLQHVGADPLPPRAVTSTRDDSALLPLARIYVHRVARTWAGGTALATTLALLVFVLVPRSSIGDHGGALGFMYEPLFAHIVWLLALTMVPMLATYVLASSLAMRRFERLTAVDARDRIDRLGRWSVGLPTAGVTVLCVFFGIMFITVGDWGLAAIFDPDEEQLVRGIAHQSLGLCSTAVIVCGLAAFALSARRSTISWLMPAGAVIVFATAIIGMRMDTGPFHEMIMFRNEPSLALRACLTASGTIGLIAFVGGTFQWRRAREDRELA